MEKDIQEILLTEEQIKTRIAELGKELTADYAGTPLSSASSRALWCFMRT